MPKKSNDYLRLELTSKIHIISRKMAHFGLKRLAEEGMPNTKISVASLLLVLLETGDMTLTGIAKRLQMPHPTATVIADRLEEKGWLSRKQGTDDRRNIYLHLTRSGKAAALKVIKVRNTVIQEMCPGLDRKCMVAAIETLDKVLENMDSSFS